jgi:hypothetical protein
LDSGNRRGTEANDRHEAYRKDSDEHETSLPGFHEVHEVQGSGVHLVQRFRRLPPKLLNLVNFLNLEPLNLMVLVDHMDLTVPSEARLRNIP